MKRIITIILGVLWCLAVSQAQAQRRLPAQVGIQINAGITDGCGLIKRNKAAYNAGFAFSRYTQNANKWLVGADYTEKRYCYKCRSVPVAQFTAEAGYYYTILSNRGKDVFFSAGLAGVAGYEVVNWGKKTFPDGATLQDKSGFIGGAALSVEIEAFISDRLAFLLHVKERTLFGSDVGIFHNQIGLGIKYIYK